MELLIWVGLGIWVWLLITALNDLFRRPDISRLGKARWGLVVIAAPYVGALSYMALRGRGIAEREASRLQQSPGMHAGGFIMADEIDKARGLVSLMQTARDRTGLPTAGSQTPLLLNREAPKPAGARSISAHRVDRTPNRWASTRKGRGPKFPLHIPAAKAVMSPEDRAGNGVR
jgi:hypothetical protein